MTTRRGSNPNRCPRCRINVKYCFCSAIKPLTIDSTVSLIVHVRELKLTSNTAQFVKEMLPGNCHFDVRGHVEGALDLAPVLARPGRPLFLYPNENAIELNPGFVKTNPGPYHLIVPDGNWHQARKVHQREPLLKDVVTVKLPPGILGEYQLRKAPQPHYVSTYEAVAHALGILESETVRDELMHFFRIFVKSVLHSRKDFFGKLEF